MEKYATAHYKVRDLTVKDKGMMHRLERNLPAAGWGFTLMEIAKAMVEADNMFGPDYKPEPAPVEVPHPDSDDGLRDGQMLTLTRYSSVIVTIANRKPRFSFKFEVNGATYFLDDVSFDDYQELINRPLKPVEEDAEWLNVHDVYEHDGELIFALEKKLWRHEVEEYYKNREQ